MIQSTHFNEGTEYSLDRIIDIIHGWHQKNDFNWICITGGEPLLQRDLNDLVKLIYPEYKILLETSGSIDIKRFLPLYKNVYKDIDFKLPSSGMYGKFNYNNLNYMSDGDYIKFVAGDIKDFNTAIEEIIKIKNNINRKIQFIIQPVYKSSIREIAEKFIESAPADVKFMIQEHKYIFGDLRGV